jgi:hypothetical protein
VVATRNNRGIAHENGVTESQHRHSKHGLEQQLIPHGSRDFATEAEYRAGHPSQGNPESILQNDHGPATTLRAQKFPVAPQGAPSGATSSYCFAEDSS